MCWLLLWAHLEVRVRQQVGEEFKYLGAVLADVPVLSVQPHKENEWSSWRSGIKTLQRAPLSLQNFSFSLTSSFSLNQVKLKVKMIVSFFLILEFLIFADFTFVPSFIVKRTIMIHHDRDAFNVQSWCLFFFFFLTYSYKKRFHRNFIEYFWTGHC